METRCSNISDILRDVAQQVSVVSTGLEGVCYRKYSVRSGAYEFMEPKATKKKKHATGWYQSPNTVWRIHLALVGLTWLLKYDIDMLQGIFAPNDSNRKILVYRVT